MLSLIYFKDQLRLCELLCLLGKRLVSCDIFLYVFALILLRPMILQQAHLVRFSNFSDKVFSFASTIWPLVLTSIFMQNLTLARKYCFGYLFVQVLITNAEFIAKHTNCCQGVFLILKTFYKVQEMNFK